MTDTWKDDGGPAFPVPPGSEQCYPGMSLRDWFAGQALQGLLANPAVMNADRYGECAQGVRGGLAISKVAGIHADAMIAARDIQGGGDG